MHNSIVKSITRKGEEWTIRYSIPFENFVEAAKSPINENTRQYGFNSFNIMGSVVINVRKVLEDSGMWDKVEEGQLFLTEALEIMQQYADENARDVYRNLTLAIDSDGDWYKHCRSLEN